MAKIKVTPAIIQRTILDIFNDYNVPMGGRLSVANLEYAWRHTGLRDRDLKAGVKFLVSEKKLEPIRVAGIIALKLTDPGSIVAGTNSDFPSLLQKIMANRVLRKTRHRVDRAGLDSKEKRQPG